MPHLTYNLVSKLLQLAKAAMADTWYLRRPSEAMVKHMGTSARSFIEQPRPGKPYGLEVLADDYEGDDDMRATHLEFVMACAEQAETLAASWLHMRAVLEEIGNTVGGPTTSYAPGIEREELQARVRKVSKLVIRGLEIK